MANVIKLKNSGTANSAPTSLEVGELAVNYADGKIYYKNTSNAVVEFAGASSLLISNTAPANTNVLWADTSVTGVGVVPVGGTTGQMLAKSSSADYDAAWATPVTSSDMALKAPLASPTFTGTVVLPSNTSIGTVSSTEIGYVDGVTSSIQTQLDSKLTATTATTSNRNMIINGAMQVAQRGTSTASITTDTIATADRWASQIGTLGTWTNSVENDAPTGSGFRKSWKWLCTTADASPAAGDYMVPQTRLEGQNLQSILKGTASAKELTLTFWVKSNVTGTYVASLYDVDNTRVVSQSYTVSASATWEKKTITFPADTTGAFDNDENRSLDVQFWLAAGSTYSSGTLATTWQTNTQSNRAAGQVNLAAATSNYWQITGVQLEVGAVATPFEFEDISTTLDKCFRYYQRMVDPAGSGVANNAAKATRVLIPLYTKMRVTPTTTISGTMNFWNGASTGGATALLGTYNSVSQAQLDFDGGVGTGGQAVSLYTTGGSQYLDFSAELG